MIGCAGARDSARWHACSSSVSQQPTWPQVRQIRRCTHRSPLRRHSSQPRALGCTGTIRSRCVQVALRMRRERDDALDVDVRAAAARGRSASAGIGPAALNSAGRRPRTPPPIRTSVTTSPGMNCTVRRGRAAPVALDGGHLEVGDRRQRLQRLADQRRALADDDRAACRGSGRPGRRPPPARPTARAARRSRRS